MWLQKVIVCETSTLDGEKCFKRLKPYNFLNTKYKYYFYILRQILYIKITSSYF